jgi:peptide/nickel transport system permease protein
LAETGITTISKVAGPKRHSFLVNVMIRMVREKPLGTAGAIIVLVLFIVGIFANILAPHGVNEISLAKRLPPPSSDYLLGTDNLGRDLLSRIIYGARVSMIVGVFGSALEVLVGILIGVLSGFFGGKFDLLVQRFVDAWMSLPWIFIVLTVMTILSGGGVLQVILVLGISRGITSSRIIRSAVIGIKENMYVLAAKAAGFTTLDILVKDIIPNIMAPILIMFTLSMGNMILSEATLSFLGFGVPPPEPSWGGMLSGEARKYMETAPWLAIWPGLALGIVVFGVNMFGDAVRDILDPRLQGGVGRWTTIKKDRKHNGHSGKREGTHEHRRKQPKRPLITERGE